MFLYFQLKGKRYGQFDENKKNFQNKNVVKLCNIKDEVSLVSSV